MEVRGGLERLEAAEGAPHAHAGAPPAALAGGLRARHRELQRAARELEGAVRAAGEGGAVWRQRVEQIAGEASALGLALEKFSGREQCRQLEERQRAELLMRRAGQGKDAAGAAMKAIDEEANMRRSVAASHQQLENIFAQGGATLVQMSGQRERLKRAHKKALDMLNKIGLSESLLKIAERRQKVDKMIVYGGMAGVSLLVLLVWWVVRAPAAGRAA